MELKIDRGLKTYDIKDIDGTLVGTIRFNPADLGMAGRAENAKKALTELGASIPENAGPEVVNNMDAAIRQQFDNIFGTKVSEVLFKDVSALALCEDGRFLYEAVLDALAPILQQAQESAAKKAVARVESHTGKYRDSAAGLAPGQKVE